MASTLRAILKINPDAVVIITTPSGGEESIDWGTTPVISQSDIDAAKLALDTETAHIRPREKAYPTIKDQLDMQYHDQVNGTTTWKDAIQAIKDANPKA